jgi:ribosome-associated translation inhibitor RaiA
MQVPLKVTFRNVRKTPDIETLIGKQTAKLERVCNHIVSCHMAVEKPQEPHRTGNPFRVRIDVTVPPQHELVVNAKDKSRSLSTIGNESLRPTDLELFSKIITEFQRLRNHCFHDVSTNHLETSESLACPQRELRDCDEDRLPQR